MLPISAPSIPLLSIFLTDVDQGDLNGARVLSECDISANGGKVYVTVAPTTNSFAARGATIPGDYVVNALTAVNGTGWLPVDFTLTFGGSAPVKVLPVDPTNSGDLIYRYVCNMVPTGTRGYEVDAKFESVKYKTTLDRDAKDGGSNTDFYEVGNDLTL